MKIYTLHTKQELGITKKKAWEFFSNPENLPLITPPWLNFKITSELSKEMYPGMIITYTVSPLLNIPMTWVTEITQVDEPNYFIDEQRFGPYKFWHHRHTFTEIKGGVLCEDIVHYALPIDPISRIANELMVKNQLKEIFDFRREYLDKEFGPPKK